MPFGIAIQTFIEILYCIIANSIGLRCTSYDIIMVYHWLSCIGMLLHIRWYCNLNIHLFTSYIYIYTHCLRACCFFLYCMAYHAISLLLQSIGDHLVGYYGMSHGIVISTLIEVLYCITFLLCGIILHIEWYYCCITQVIIYWDIIAYHMVV